MNQQTELTFLAALKNHLSGKAEPLQIEDFEAVEKLSIAHFCLPLVAQGISAGDGTLPGHWQEISFAVAMRNMQNVSVLKQLLEILQKAEIPCVLLKGAGVAACYPEPLVRPLGDIDLLVREEDYEKALTLILGTEERDPKQKNHAFHYHFKLGDVIVEIHKGVMEYQDEPKGAEIQALLEAAISQPETARYEGVSFPVYQAPYQALTLLLHTKRHFVRMKVSMRMLCDWVMFARSVPLEIWQRDVAPLIREYSLAELADSMTDMGIRYLGCDCKDKLVGEPDERLTDAMVEETLYVLAYGNADATDLLASNYAKARKKGKSALAAAVITVNDLVRHKYPITKEKPVLLPVYWLWILVSYPIRFLTGRNKALSAGRMNEINKRRQYLFEKLK